jgi:hypothetical protein
MIRTTQSGGSENEKLKGTGLHQSWGANPRIPGVRFEGPHLESATIFSYTHLEWLEWVRKPDGEIIKIHFTSHTVTVIGTNLRELLLGLQQMEVEWVSPLPRRFAALVADTTAMVFSIGVAERNDQSAGGSGG